MPCACLHVATSRTQELTAVASKLPPCPAPAFLSKRVALMLTRVPILCLPGLLAGPRHAVDPPVSLRGARRSGAWRRRAGGGSRRRDCHFTDIPSPCLEPCIEKPTKGRGECSRMTVDRRRVLHVGGGVECVVRGDAARGQRPDHGRRGQQHPGRKRASHRPRRRETAVAAKTLPLRCVSTALAAKKLPFHYLCDAFPLPLRCVSTALAAKKLPFHYLAFAMRFHCLCAAFPPPPPQEQHGRVHRRRRFRPREAVPLRFAPRRRAENR